MPFPNATPEEIGNFGIHSLADYWDETHEVEFNVNLNQGRVCLQTHLIKSKM